MKKILILLSLVIFVRCTECKTVETVPTNDSTIIVGNIDTLKDINECDSLYNYVDSLSVLSNTITIK